MNGKDRITEADLNAYVDRELDPARREIVAAHLADHPEDRKRVAAWQEQAATLNALYGHLIDEAPPARLSPGRLVAERRRKLRHMAMATAAALALVVLGGMAGWVGRGLVTPGIAEVALVREAEAAHVLYTPEVLHPVEVGAADGAHLTKWLSKRLDRSLVIPDLSTEGFALVGGRLLPAAGGPAALLMYENQDGIRVTLYVVPKAGGETGMRFSAAGQLTAVSWQAGALGCVLVGNLPRETLMKLARASYGSLDSGSNA